MKNKTIVIFAHSRSQLLHDCISSVLNAKSSTEWRKVIVLQEGNMETSKVVKKFNKFFDLVVTIKPQYAEILANINSNRIVGTAIGFDGMNSDYVLGIEEDTMIGYDSLVFIDEMCNRYQNHSAFRGINLGSVEKISDEGSGSYSLIRFGLHGQAGVLTRKTWKRAKLEKIFRKITYEGWDSGIEFIAKSGFMVTPNASRSLDRGWSGTFAPKEPTHPHFTKMKESWVGLEPISKPLYSHVQVQHNWRRDSKAYKRTNSFLYFLRKIGVRNVRSKIKNLISVLR
jgi:hypothetical protein